jgi:hypothetical protein
MSSASLLLFVMLAAACTTAVPADTPPLSRELALQNYKTSLYYCKAARESRTSTLGPPVFQPITGDEAFEACIVQAKMGLEAQLGRGH